MGSGHRDAVDPKALKKQRALEHRRRVRWLDNYRAVLATPQGRFVLRDLITTAGTDASPWSAVQMEIHRNIGRQEIGRMLVATLKEADEDLYVLMERETRALARRDANEETTGQEPSDPGQALTEQEQPE
jgi:hypothetical protein